MNWRNRRNCRWHAVARLIRRFEEVGVGVELGVKEGRFSAYLLEQFPSLHMYGVDLCRAREKRDRLGYETYDDWDWDAILEEQEQNLAKVAKRFTLLRMSTVRAADLFEPASVDFVFVDAEHTYEGVRDDIAAWRDKIIDGGILCGHDYNPNKPRFEGLMRAVDEFGEVRVETDHVWWTTIRR